MIKRACTWAAVAALALTAGAVAAGAVAAGAVAAGAVAAGAASKKTRTSASIEAAKAAPELKEIQTQNAEALKALEGYNYKKANQALEKAQEIAEGEGLSGQPELAQTSMLLGIAAITSSNDLYRGQHYFVRALRQNAKAEIPQSLATLQLNEVLERAKKTISAVGKPPTIKLADEKAQEEAKAAELAKQAQVRGLQHTAIEMVRAKMPVPMRVQAGSDVQAHAIYIFYRAAGKVEFTRAAMRKTGNWWHGEIPAGIVSGKYFHYYIAAYDQRDRQTASNGSARNPNVVVIK